MKVFLAGLIVFFCVSLFAQYPPNPIGQNTYTGISNLAKTTNAGKPNWVWSQVCGAMSNWVESQGYSVIGGNGLNTSWSNIINGKLGNSWSNIINGKLGNSWSNIINGKLGNSWSNIINGKLGNSWSNTINGKESLANKSSDITLGFQGSAITLTGNYYTSICSYGTNYYTTYATNVFCWNKNNVLISTYGNEAKNITNISSIAADSGFLYVVAGHSVYKYARNNFAYSISGLGIVGTTENIKVDTNYLYVPVYASENFNVYTKTFGLVQLVTSFIPGVYTFPFDKNYLYFGNLIYTNKPSFAYVTSDTNAGHSRFINAVDNLYQYDGYGNVSSKTYPYITVASNNIGTYTYQIAANNINVYYALGTTLKIFKQYTAPSTTLYPNQFAVSGAIQNNNTLLTNLVNHLPLEIPFSVSGVLATNSTASLGFVRSMQTGILQKQWYGYLKTPSTNGTVIVDILKNGTSIFSNGKIGFTNRQHTSTNGILTGAATIHSAGDYYDIIIKATGGIAANLMINGIIK